MRRTLAFLSIVTVMLAGCAVFIRGAGATRTVKGIVLLETEGSPVVGASVILRGIDHVPLIVRLIPAPISPTNQPLGEVRTDSDGRFLFKVPYYEHYHLMVSQPWPYWGGIEDEEKLTHSDVVIRVKPNKTLEPTTTSVTPRATAGDSK